MNTALAKIAHCWKERAGDSARDVYAVGERIFGYDNSYLINEALLGGHAGLELARILGWKFLREMRERVLELEADKSGPLPLNYLVVLEACGASANQLLGVEQSLLEDCRWMLKMPLE